MLKLNGKKGFQKNDIFFSMKILWIFFWGWGGGLIAKLDFLVDHFYVFKGLFLRYRMGIFFRFAKI